MSELYWRAIETIEDEPASDVEKVYHALLWGRLTVRGTQDRWVTEWKVLKAAWVRWTGTAVNGSAKQGWNWYVAGGDDAVARIELVEATHFMPLPDAPADGPRMRDERA